MVDFLQQILEGLGAEPTVLIMSMLPVIELRGAIPVGVALGLSPLHSTILGFIGSMVPVPFILFVPGSSQGAAPKGVRPPKLW